MAMTAGTVTIAANGTPTKSGMAEAIYDAFESSMPAAQFADAASKTIWANMSTAIASAVVTYLAANAEAVITTSTAALQQTTAEGDTLAPSAERTLSIQ